MSISTLGSSGWGWGNSLISTEEAAWTPADVANLLWWFDFSQIATLFQDAARTVPVVLNGDPIGGVTDLSGNARHLSQVTAANKFTYIQAVINGLSTGRCAHPDDHLNMPANVSSNAAVYFVMRTSAVISTYWKAFLCSNYNVGFNIIGGVVGTGIEYWDSGALSTFATVSPNTNYQLGYVRVGAVVTEYRNAGTNPKGNAGSNLILRTLAHSMPGGGYGWDGDYGEAFAYSAALPSDDHDSAWAYLRNKWAVY